MTRVHLVGLVLIPWILVSCAWRPDPWRREDTYRHTAMTTLKVIDWQQTREIAKSKTYWEMNPILGKHPEASEVDRYFAVSYITSTTIACLLSESWRKKWQWAWICCSGIMVTRNYSIGLKGEW